MVLEQALQTINEHRGGLACAAASAGASLLALRILFRTRADRFEEVPGSWLLGVLPQLGKGAELMAHKVEEWAKTYGQEGAYEFNLAGQRMVVVSSWEHAYPVLKARPFKVKKATYWSNVHDMVTGSFFSEGERWKKERRVLSPAFSSKNVEGYVPAVELITQKLLQEMDKDVALNGEVNFSDLLPLYTADVICKTSLGQDFRMLEARKSDIVTDVKQMFGAMQLRLFAALPYWKIPGLAGLVDGGNTISRRFFKRSEQILRDATGDGTSIAEKLRNMDGEKFTHDELINNVTVLFLGGTDTTSLVLSWSFYYLSCDEKLQNAVAKEVRSLPAGEISLSQLQSLPTVQAVWLESLRLRGPAAVFGLEPTEDVTIAGRKVPAGTHVMVALRNILKHDPSVKRSLGDDLEVFRASRWLNADGGVIRAQPFDTLSFGYGPRICLGMRLAEYEGLLVIAKVIQKFVLQQWDKPPLQDFSTFVQNEPTAPVSIRLQERAW